METNMLSAEPDLCGFHPPFYAGLEDSGDLLLAQGVATLQGRETWHGRQSTGTTKQGRLSSGTGQKTSGPGTRNAGLRSATEPGSSPSGRKTCPHGKLSTSDPEMLAWTLAVAVPRTGARVPLVPSVLPVLCPDQTP